MPEPLVKDVLARREVSEFLDRRIAAYQQQRELAEKARHRWPSKISGLLIDELLDVRNAILGVPGSSPMLTRDRLADKPRPAQTPECEPSGEIPPQTDGSPLER
jgi:hypothetical protein